MTGDADEVDDGFTRSTVVELLSDQVAALQEAVAAQQAALERCLRRIEALERRAPQRPPAAPAPQ
jgi:hypothetical protein